METTASRAYRAWPPRRGLAGAEGFEPPLAVLETAGLPLNLRPYSHTYKQTSTLASEIKPVNQLYQKAAVSRG